MLNPGRGGAVRFLKYHLKVQSPHSWNSQQSGWRFTFAFSFHSTQSTRTTKTVCCCLTKQNNGWICWDIQASEISLNICIFSCLVSHEFTVSEISHHHSDPSACTHPFPSQSSQFLTKNTEMAGYFINRNTHHNLSFQHFCPCFGTTMHVCDYRAQ